MTRISFSAFFFFLSWNANLFGQLNRFETGVEGGPAMTTLWGNDLIENKVPGSMKYKNDIYYSQGAFFRYNFLPWIGIQSGVSYEKIGNRVDLQFTDINNNVVDTGYIKAQFEYLTFPLLFKFQVGNKIKFNFTAGGFFSYLLTSRTVISQVDAFNNQGETAYESVAIFRRFNSGVVFGAGIDYTFKNNINIGFECRNQLGIYNISALPVTNNQNVRTNSLQFLFRLSYKFGIPK